MLINEWINQDIFKVVINSIYNGIVIIDHLGKIIVFNDSAERITNHAHRTWYDEAPSKGALRLGKPLKGLFVVYS
jgi:PAS domain-containing protein